MAMGSAARVRLPTMAILFGLCRFRDAISVVTQERVVAEHARDKLTIDRLELSTRPELQRVGRDPIGVA